MSAPYQFLEFHGLTRVLKVLLYLGAALAVVAIVSSWLQVELVRRETFTQEQGDANDMRQFAIDLLRAALYLATVVVFCCWIVRANKNARALGATGLRTTPGWAAGWFFVPIFNLWRPYQAMKELWLASHYPESWTRIDASPLLPAWWTLWIVANIVLRLSSRMVSRSTTASDVLYGTWFEIAGELAFAALCLVAAALVTQIANAQHAHAQQTA